MKNVRSLVAGITAITLSLATAASAQTLTFTFATPSGLATDNVEIAARGTTSDVRVYLTAAPGETIVRTVGITGFGVRVVYPAFAPVAATTDVTVNPQFNGIKSVRLLNGGVNVLASTTGAGVPVDAAGRVLLATIRFTGNCPGAALLVTSDPNVLSSNTVAPGSITLDSLIANSSAVVSVGGPACRGDFNCSGSVTVQDIFDFLTAWFGNDPSADINGGGISVQDLFDFLTAWFTPC